MTPHDLMTLDTIRRHCLLAGRPEWAAVVQRALDELQRRRAAEQKASQQPIPQEVLDAVRSQFFLRYSGSPFMRRLRSLFAWRTVRDTGIWIYQENAITGERRVLRHVGVSRCYQPVAHHWLGGRDWDHPRPSPPPSRDH